MYSLPDIVPNPVALCAYFAGFIDGDGMIAINKKRNPTRYALDVNAVNTCREPLDLLSTHFGGSVSGPYAQHGPPYRPVWRWHAYAKEAERCLQQLLPFFVIKRERAELALTFRSLFVGECRMDRCVDSDQNQRRLADRHACYELMRDLNRKGTGHPRTAPSQESVHAS